MRAQRQYLSYWYSSKTTRFPIYSQCLKVWWDGSTSSLGQVNHVLSVGLKRYNLTSTHVDRTNLSPWRLSQPSRRPRWAASWRCRRGAEMENRTWNTSPLLKQLHHLYLILGSLVGVPSLVSPPDADSQSGPPAGLKMFMMTIKQCLSIFGLPW